MDVNIGPVLVAQRKAQHLTQQQLADFIGVSKAAVSKWETGKTYPDITLLPALAAYFNMSIDDLLNYEPQLSATEIQHIYAALKADFDTKPGTEVLTTIRSFIRRYYACYPFIQQMGLLILNHFDLLPGEDLAAKQATYVPEAQALFVHVRDNAQDVDLVSQARNMEGYTLLLLNKPQAVLDLLGTRTPAYLPVESLIATAFQQQDDLKAAQGIYQSALAQYLSIMMSQFSNYLQLLVKDPAKFAATYHRGQGVADVFAFGTLNPVAMMNFQLSAATGFAQQHQTEALFTVLTAFADLFAHLEFPVVLHGDAYFDQIDDWLAHLDIGTQLPRGAQQVQSGLRDYVLQSPAFAPYQDDPRMRAIQQQLKGSEQV
ncbi:XRE family transcriptional regulator [Agrilactobacillus composti DSM 18527 = JCM 14202]|uniref:XRE family transcriptional regulator n=1 Tax=Agrilactobacillus composti DSM 18527 = JCM 14202 TaxID=1423734 RepID=X0PQ52_9LACO|nr:helix-turn-helix transcriptional regulator [Agrilactobacillus composti]KRM33654.1 XRE family transcriptional regulator [Agrilactobacillus composti DSM 18527 = JCM 14202]GAF39176.1 transcriptional regulator, Cro/CI family [Agrilactobacillus composti DSM 18527 = JCM 14202]